MAKMALFAGVVLLGFFSFLLGSNWAVLFPDVEKLPFDPDCDLHAGSCSRELPGGGSLSFSITPADVPLMKPLMLKVQLQTVSVEHVGVDIVGINMQMGLNRTRLKSTGNGYWQGETILPVCSQKNMLWEAGVQLGSGADAITVPFRFDTRRP